MKKFVILIVFIISFLAYPQNCNITATDIFGNTSTQLSCGTNGCVELSTNVPSSFLTTSYSVESQAYAPVIPFNQGTSLNADFDDGFSGIIPMPFNFCFYGNTYNKMVVSSNGFITFDTTQAGMISNPNILATNPDDLLPKNAIFGTMQDLIFSKDEDSEIYYSVIGNSPCRKFIINFYKARLTGCTDTTSFQIVLSEFSSEIEINIENKPLPCTSARFKESLIGIINADGTNGLSPSGRNKEIWQSGNESWKLSPKGNKISPNITWRNSSNQEVGSTATINACPKKTEKYTVTLNYSICGTNYIFSDDIDITYSLDGSLPNINTPVNFSYSTCDNNADNVEGFPWTTLINPLITTESNVNVRYYETFARAEAGGAGISTVKTGQYTVYARVTNQYGCYTIGEVHMDITFLPKINAREISKKYCFDGTEDFPIDLNKLYPEMLTTPISEITKVTFYDNEIDATTSNLLTVLNPIQIIEEDNNLLIYNYFARFENANGCFTVKKIKITLQNPIANQNLEICDFGNNETEDIILSRLTASLVGTQPVKVSYYSNPTSASANSGAITTYQLTKANSPGIVYARLDMNSDNGNCFRVYPINLKLIASPGLTKSTITVNLGSICDNNNDGLEKHDLTLYQKDIYSGVEKFSYTYYQNYNTSSGILSNQISKPTDFSITKNTEIYVRVSNSTCFSIAKIILNFTFLPAVILKQGLIAKCDKNYDYGETYDLNDAKPTMFDQSNTLSLEDMKVTYFLNKEDANQGTKTISNIQTTQTNIVTFWVRFESISSQCFSVAPVALKTYFPPKAIPSTINNVCDNNLDGNPEINLLLPEYTDKMTSEIDPENNFTFYLTQEDILNNNPIIDPENFSPNPFPTRIWVLADNIPGCYDSPQSIDFNFGTPVPINQNSFLLPQCDDGNDGKEIINLTQFEHLIYKTGASYSYYPTLEDINNNRNKIQKPSEYSYDSHLQSSEIYVSTNVAGYCPSLAKININLKSSPIFDLPTYNFCPGVGIKLQPDLNYLNPKSFVWKNPKGEIISKEKDTEQIKDEGKYSLTITSDNGCSHTDYFDIIAYEVPIIQELLAIDATSYKVIATGSKKILYSIDNLDWQESNIFENLKFGPVNFYVRFEDSECLGETKAGLSVKVSNIFSPNNDGINDIWNFKDLNVYGDKPSILKIYDSRGILIYEQISSESFNWDGKFNKRSLPTSSYWYDITFPDKKISGWILLKNRN